MRVALITNIVAPSRTPVFEQVAKTGVELLVVYESRSEPNRRWVHETPLGFDHVFLESRTVDLRGLASDAFVHLPRRPLAAIRDFAPDVVITAGGGIWSSPTNVAAAVMRDWAVIPWWGSPRRPHPSLVRRLAEPWVRAFIRHADAWLAYGTRAAAEVVRLGADPARTVIAPNAVPAAAPMASEPRPHDPFRFLFVGQLIERKGVDLLLDAFASTSKSELWIAGDGPLRAVVENAAKRNKAIHALGYVEPSKLAEVYRAADALVLPSRYEVWGLVVNEALGEGAAVIVSDEVGAADDLLRNEINGLVVPAGSRDRLADAMRDMEQWPADYFRRAAECSRQILSKWSVEHTADAVVRACRLAVERRGRDALSQPAAESE